MKRIAYFCALLLTALCWSCSSDNEIKVDPGQTNPPVVTHTKYQLSEDTLVVREDGITIAMPASAIGEGVEMEVTKKASTEPLLGCDVRNVVFDISAGDQHDINGIIEITIPFQRSASGNDIGAGYYNPTTKEWEPVDWNYKNGNVVITTDHLSKYGVFEVKYENTSMANFVATCETYGNMFGPNAYDFTLPMQAFVALSQTDGTTSKVLDVVSEVYGDGSQYLVDLGYNSVKALGFDTAIDGFMKDYGNHMAILGATFTTWQVARLVHQGNKPEAFKSIMEAAATNTISYLGTAFGSTFGVVGLAAYLASKYVINSFFEGVISSRKDVWVQAYEKYQKEHPRYFKDWYERIYPIAVDDGLEDYEKEEKIDKLVHNYCYEFWDNFDRVLEYYYEVTGHTSGAGMNEYSQMYIDMKREISENRRGQIYQNVIPQVMTEINGKLREQNFKIYKDEVLKYQKMMNKEFTLNFVDDNLKDGKSELEGYKVKFAELPKGIDDPNKWECTLDKSGKGTIKLTLFAYVKNKMQPKMILVDKKGKTVKELEFVPNPPTNTIAIGNVELPGDDDEQLAQIKKELIGEWMYNEFFSSDSTYIGDYLTYYNTSYTCIVFDENGGYKEIHYSGLRDEDCVTLSCTKQGMVGHLENEGRYTVYRNKEMSGRICVKMESSMGKYSFDRYTETEFIIPRDIEEVTNIQAKKGFVHKCTAKKLYLNNWPLYKGVWKFHEIMPMLPNKKISIGFSCIIKGVRTYDDAHKTEEGFSKYLSFSNSFGKYSVSGDGTYSFKCSDATNGVEATAKIVMGMGADGYYHFYLTSATMDVDNETGRHQWSASNLNEMLTPSNSANLAAKANQESGVKISCTYSLDGNPSEVGELDPKSNYSVSVSL